MKKSVFLVSVVASFLISLSMASAVLPCSLSADLINQDPYPAIPGDYVKLVFQLRGIENPACNVVSFELLANYPISFDPGEQSVVSARGGTYSRDYNSYLSIPYEVRIDEDALDGETPIEVRFGAGGDAESRNQLETFYLEIEEVRAEFEVHVDDYSPTTKELTIEVLNIAENDIEALTLEIPSQDGVKVIGTNRVIVGDLDSNEYTTADFKAELSVEEIMLNIYYTDKIGTRRDLQQSVVFDDTLFAENGESGSSLVYWIIAIVVIALIVWWFLRRRKKKKAKHHTHHKNH